MRTYLPIATYKHFGGCLGQLRRLLLVLEHGIVVGGVSPHDAVAGGDVAAVPGVAAVADVAAVAGQWQQGDRLALLLLLVVEVQQGVERQGQARGTLRSAMIDPIIIWFPRRLVYSLTWSDSAGLPPRSSDADGPGRRSEIVYSYRVRS